MIIEKTFEVLDAFLSGVLGMFPNPNPPGWTESLGSSLALVWTYASGLGAWIPWTTVGYVIQAVVACMITGLLIRLVRVVLSLFTGGGGSAA